MHSIYRNSFLAVSKDDGSTTPPVNNILRVSYHNNVYGKIDELSQWSKELSVTEIENLYNSGQGCFYKI